MSDPIQTPATSPAAPDVLRNEETAEMVSTTAADEKTRNEKESSAPGKPPAPAVDVAALTDRALHFLSTASNETLSACLVGLSAGTYLILGRVGLLLIGVVGGVVLHAQWEGHAQGGSDSSAKSPETRRRELGVDVAHRLLHWRGGAKREEGDQTEDSDTDIKLYSGRPLDYSSFKPQTAAALTELTDAVIRDYVKWWYSPVLPTEESFPATCRQTLTAFLLSVSSHLSRKRPADNFVDFVTRSSSFMIIFFQELSAAINACPGSTAPEAVETYLDMKPDSTLANILDSKYQGKQFDNAADDILQNYLEPKTYNCKPAQVFLRQILSKVVLEMIVVSCSKPGWINGWIVYLLEDGEPELMNAIDAGVEGSSPQINKVKNTVEKEEKMIESDQETRSHKRAVSRAQEAMDDAMREAQRLSQLIADEDARKLKDQLSASNTSIPPAPVQQSTSSSSLVDDRSESTTQGIVTPTSSQSETQADNDVDLGISNLPSQAAYHVNLNSPSKGCAESPKKDVSRSFTSFDQLVPQQPPTALMENAPPPPPPLTLYSCKISIFDDAAPGERGTIKNKPTADYLMQIEPQSHHHSGWMTVRKYSDFETLHEVIRRIAAITGANGFNEAHASLPAWKGHTKASLTGELERYINDAVQHQSLAESEGMKRFLEKEAQMNKSPGSKGFPGWPGQAFETMGKGMIDVLTKAPKEVAGGGKAFFGGVSGVLGSVATPLGGGKKNRDSVSASPASLSRSATASSTPPAQGKHNRAESTVSELPTHIRTESTMSSLTRRPSTDSLRNPTSPIIDQQPQREAPMERRPSYNPDGDGKRSGPSSIFGTSRSNSRAPSVRESMEFSPVLGGDQILNLPPPPSDMPDDYSSPTATRNSLDPFHSRQASRASTSSLPLPPEALPPLPRRPSATSLASKLSSKPAPTQKPKEYPPLSEQETTVLIELFFAVINELYTLSSAWNIRRTLLNAAKTFLLRPGNPQLESIRQLMQSTVLDANSSDTGIAYHLRKIRENSLPTEDELKAWPAESSAEEKERLRGKARKLLVERGMPQALTSVMGMAASGEALGKVFDALQEPKLARGVIFGLTLQGLRAVTQ